MLSGLWAITNNNYIYTHNHPIFKANERKLKNEKDDDSGIRFGSHLKLSLCRHSD